MKSLFRNLSFILSISLAIIPHSVATIAYGTQDSYDVAWIYGANPCNSVAEITYQGSNPCGIKFTLSNGYKYYFQHCGESTFAVYNSDGSFNHGCSYNTKTITCPGGDVQQVWVC